MTCHCIVHWGEYYFQCFLIFTEGVRSGTTTARTLWPKGLPCPIVVFLPIDLQVDHLCRCNGPRRSRGPLASLRWRQGTTRFTSLASSTIMARWRPTTRIAMLSHYPTMLLQRPMSSYNWFRTSIKENMIWVIVFMFFLRAERSEFRVRSERRDYSVVEFCSLTCWQQNKAIQRLRSHANWMIHKNCFWILWLFEGRFLLIVVVDFVSAYACMIRQPFLCIIAVIPQPVYMNAEEMEKMRKLKQQEDGALSESSSPLRRSNSRNSQLVSGKQPILVEEFPDEEDLKTPTVEELSFPGQKVVRSHIPCLLLKTK